MSAEDEACELRKLLSVEKARTAKYEMALRAIAEMACGEHDEESECQPECGISIARAALGDA